jgi:hypothetical protein
MSKSNKGKHQQKLVLIVAVVLLLVACGGIVFYPGWHQRSTENYIRTTYENTLKLPTQLSLSHSSCESSSCTFAYTVAANRLNLTGQLLHALDDGHFTFESNLASDSAGLPTDKTGPSHIEAHDTYLQMDITLSPQDRKDSGYENVTAVTVVVQEVQK